MSSADRYLVELDPLLAQHQKCLYNSTPYQVIHCQAPPGQTLQNKAPMGLFVNTCEYRISEHLDGFGKRVKGAWLQGHLLKRKFRDAKGE